MLNRPKPNKGESLTGYLQRVAQANYISSHELWRWFILKGKHYPQSSMARVIDFVPGCLLDLKKMTCSLNINKETILLMTFQEALSKFYPYGTSETQLLSSKILSGITLQTRWFCPECLEEELFYKLIWQVKEIEVCPKHKVELISCCPRCHRSIPLLDVKSKVGLCSYCNSSLADAPRINTTDMDKSRCDDWNYLLGVNDNFLTMGSNYKCNFNQILASKLIYTACNYQETYSKETLKKSCFNKNTQQVLLQTARGTRVGSRVLHIDNFLNLIRLLRLNIEIIPKINVLTSFLDSLLSQKETIKEKISCIAPWCKSYKKPGSLHRTLTSVKSLIGGENLKYYLYCNECGIEYAIDANTGTLIERGYFINLAWYKVRPLLLENKTLAQVALELSQTKDRIRRCCIFLFANSLVEKNNIPFNVPEQHEDSKLEIMLEEINKGVRAKGFWRNQGWIYNEFLFYWFRSDVQVAYIQRKIPREDKRIDKLQKQERVLEVLNNLLDNNISITIAKVAEAMSVCPETLRQWEVLKINKAKTEQKSIRHKIHT